MLLALVGSAQECFNFHLPSVLCPIGRCALPDDILQIQPRTAFGQQPDSLDVTGECRLVQRSSNANGSLPGYIG